MWNGFKEPLTILLFLADGRGSRGECGTWLQKESVTHPWGKTQHALILWLKWLNFPLDVLLFGLLPSESQHYMSCIRGYKRRSHTAFSDHTCTGFRMFCNSPTFQVLKVFQLSYVTTSAAILFLGPSLAFFFSSLSHPHHNYIWLQLPAVIFFLFLRFLFFLF